MIRLYRSSQPAVDVHCIFQPAFKRVPEYRTGTSSCYPPCTSPSVCSRKCTSHFMLSPFRTSSRGSIVVSVDGSLPAFVACDMSGVQAIESKTTKDSGTSEVDILLYGDHIIIANLRFQRCRDWVLSKRLSQVPV